MSHHRRHRRRQTQTPFDTDAALQALRNIAAALQRFCQAMVKIWNDMSAEERTAFQEDVLQQSTKRADQ